MSSSSLNKTGLNCMGLLTHGYFFNECIGKFLRDLQQFEKTQHLHSLEILKKNKKKLCYRSIKYKYTLLYFIIYYYKIYRYCYNLSKLTHLFIVERNVNKQMQY